MRNILRDTPRATPNGTPETKPIVSTVIPALLIQSTCAVASRKSSALVIPFFWKYTMAK
jgi:hypothetical protein